MTLSSNSALGAESLLSFMVKSLPAKASDESRPVIKDAYAAIALFVHACMLAVGFRLVGLGEDHKIGTADAPGYLRALTASRCLVGFARYPDAALRVGRFFRIRFSICARTIIDGISGESQ